MGSLGIYVVPQIMKQFKAVTEVDSQCVYIRVKSGCVQIEDGLDMML